VADGGQEEEMIDVNYVKRKDRGKGRGGGRGDERGTLRQTSFPDFMLLRDRNNASRRFKAIVRSTL